MTMFGGLGNLFGSIPGAAILQLLQPILEMTIRIDPGKAFLIQLVFYGARLAVMTCVRPQGPIPEGASLFLPRKEGIRLHRRRGRPAWRARRRRLRDPA